VDPKYKRIIIGFFMPLLLANFITLIFAELFSFDNLLRSLSRFGFFGVITLIFQIIFGGMQTLLYSLLMEFVVNKKIKNIFSICFISGLLGMGVYFSALFFYYLSDNYMTGLPRSFNFLSPSSDNPLIILLIGVFVGYALNKMYHKSANKNLHRT